MSFLSITEDRTTTNGPSNSQSTEGTGKATQRKSRSMNANQGIAKILLELNNICPLFSEQLRR